MAHIPTPRLLPLTIFAMGGLLAMKSVTLVRAAASGADAGAVAAAPAVAPAHAAASATQGNPAAAATTTQGTSTQGTTTLGTTTQGTTTQGTTTQTAPGAAPVMPSMPPPPAPAVGAGERTGLLELAAVRHRAGRARNHGERTGSDAGGG